MQPINQVSYESWTRKPVRYLPVTCEGRLIGYLWAAVGSDAAGYERCLAADPDNMTCLSFWFDRLSENYRNGLDPVIAIRQWIGVPEDPRCGGIDASAVEREAPSLQAMWAELNPEAEPMGEGPWVQDGELPSGTPVDRSKGWSTPVMATPPTYAKHASSTVHYLPVVKDGVLIAYLWASPTDHAADYLPVASAGEQARAGAGLWQLRLSDFYATGTPPLDALRQCRNYPHDFMSGVIPADAHELVAPTLDELKALANG
ncbi:hypothetical protein GV791_20260 [Nocardia cyriacigeorgica]|uniref:Uncharacterized protein n=1 Tax=Nocardia cyriacigeorgica TaxID=135487 RepID=A0A6P1CTZ1_9NOCA|nr:hypothetical protein [Nocardia cyriacigeorgica]NEW34874.1 hypothetical protein [Nocardia cyriacigeorgica]